MTAPKKISTSFYDRPTLEVAKDAIGKYIVFNSPNQRLSARIVEVEAYIGETDPACHAHRGMTKRNKPLYGNPGTSYVYLIYGMYFCFNLITEKSGKAAALLIRGAEPSEGLEIMQENSPIKKPKRPSFELLNGPGKFCRSFGINLSQNCLDLNGETIYLEDRFEKVGKIRTSPRIGISHGKDLEWRFFEDSSKAVSKG